MMTFSFRPTSLSLFAWIAASVRTLVVSWNDAADSHDSVPSAGAALPLRLRRGGSAALAPLPPVLRLELGALHQRPGQELRRPRVDHRHPLEHLPDDDLDVLVVDRHALRPVHLLDLPDQVQLHLP